MARDLNQMKPRMLSRLIARAWAAAGRRYFLREHWEKAAYAYSKAIEYNNRHGLWYFQLARCYERVPYYEGAAQAYIAALAQTGTFSTPKSLTRIVALINCLSETGRAPTAQSLRDALRRNLGLEHIPAAIQSDHRIKIAYIPNSPLPDLNASCVHAMKLCRALLRTGQDVMIVSSQPKSRHWDNTSDALDFFGVPHLKLLLIDSSGTDKADDIKRIKIALDNGATHCLSRSSVAAYCAALVGMPTILEVHRATNADTCTLSKELLRQSSFRGFVVTTGALKRIVEAELSEPNAPIHIVPNAADPPESGDTDFMLTAFRGTTLQVGYVGHLYPGKGLEMLQTLAQALPKVGFHVMGGYQEDVELWQAKTTGVMNIQFYGFRPSGEVSAFLKKIDVALAPYSKQVGIFGGAEQDQSFSSSLKLFEYMAHGLPIVASDLPGIREVLKHGENALLCDPDNIGSWIAALEDLGKDSDFRKRLASNAEASFRQSYTWEKRVSRLISILGVHA